MLFSEKVSEVTGEKVSGWEDSFTAVTKHYKVIILDDLTSISSYNRFHTAFYEKMFPKRLSRPFVVLIAQPTDNVAGLADRYERLELTYLNISEVMDMFPNYTKYDALSVSAISGGIPEILQEIKPDYSLEYNLQKILNPTSAFINFMPRLLSQYFRKPDNYHYILSAIAHGSHSISEIGKFTGFAYNKCDNYLAGLIDCGIVIPDDVVSKRGAKKTAYNLTNNYFRLWYRYIYWSQSDIQLEVTPVINKIVKSIIDMEVQVFYLQKVFEYVNKRINSYDMQIGFNILSDLVYEPYIVNNGNNEFTFDSIGRNKEMAVMVKILNEPEDSCRKETFETIRKAAALVNEYYNSHVYIFAKKRFSDYAVKEASKDEAITLVGIEQLR